MQAYRIRIAPGGLTAPGRKVTLIAKQVMCVDWNAFSDWTLCQIQVSGVACNSCPVPSTNTRSNVTSNVTRSNVPQPACKLADKITSQGFTLPSVFIYEI